jgi:hypothetical protein
VGVRNSLLILLAFVCFSCASSAQRHQRVAQRRAGIAIICHRGAHEFAHENTLEAYRATFELGGDGNEIDIRQTKDGVLVLFHDDILDLNLKAAGDVSDYTWEDLQTFEFRDPGPFGDACRIPTLKEVFELHKEYAGLIHLDIKVPNIDTNIEKMLDDMDMWDQVCNVSEYYSENIRKNPKLHPRPYKGGIYANHEEVFPDAIAVVLKNPGNDFICDDPRGVAIALGRKLGKCSTTPVAPSPQRTIAAAIDTRSDADLEKTVRNRALSSDWRIHGLDGATALRTLIERRSHGALELARFVLWRDDPSLVALNNPDYKVPPSWVDWRMKNVVFSTLEKCPGTETEKLCRDYLALSDDQARKIGPPQFEPAAHTLLTISPNTETAVELMHHRLQIVRGRAILDCLKHHDEKWAMDALKSAAPHALAYIPPQ